MMADSIVDRFAKVAADHPTRVAVFAPSEGRHYTFGEIWDDHLALRAALMARKVPSDAAIVSNVGNRSSFFSLLLTCLAGARSLILLDGGAPGCEALKVARALGARALVAPTVNTASGPDSVPLPAGLSVTLTAETRVAPVDCSACVVKMTSGSSALPKGVLVTEQALIEDGRHIIGAMGLREDDLNLAVIPLAHSYGLGNLVMPLLLQGTPLVLRAGFVARQLLGDIRAFGATVLPGVPYIYDYLVRLESGLSALSELRLAITAGAPIEPHVIRLYAKRFGRKVHSFYGTSETGGIAYDASDELHEATTVGRPLPGVSVSLVGQPDLPVGEGRVHVEGEALGYGYAGSLGSEGPEKFVDGGFLTGDLGRLDEHGRLWLRGRVSKFVNVAGRKVDPGEVERVIGEAPGIADVLVFGVPGPPRGEVLVACVRSSDRVASPETIRAWCARRLPPHTVPRLVLVLDAFPTDGRGKTDRQALGRIASDAAGGWASVPTGD